MAKTLSFFSNKVTGASVGTALGRLYGGPIASSIARAVAERVIPAGGALWNFAVRTPTISHIAGQSYVLGNTFGPVAGGVAGAAVTQATKLIVDKAVKYNQQKNLNNSYNQLGINQQNYLVGELGTQDTGEDEYVVIDSVIRNTPTFRPIF